MIACCAPPVLLAVDFAVLSVAVPRLGADLAMGRGEVGWLFSAYSLVFGCLLLAAGRAADALGRRRVLLAGLGVFAAGGALTACAGTAATAIAGRAVEGAGAALMTPAALALMTAATREGEERRRALAAYGLAISAGFVTGTLVSGVVATVASWRVAVAALVPLAAGAMVAAWRLLEPDPAPRHRAAPRHHAAPRHRAAPRSRGRALAPPGRNMAVACAAGLVVTGTGAAATLLLTLHLQDARGYSPLGAALVFACFGAAALPGAAVARRLAAGAAVSAGLAVQGAGLLTAVAAAGSGPAIAASVAGFGFGHVIGNAAVAAVATAGRAAARHGAVIGVLITAQYLGGALGPALLGRASFEAGMAAAGAIALATAAGVWWAHAAA